MLADMARPRVGDRRLSNDQLDTVPEHHSSALTLVHLT